jgi:hypothetical protein
MGDASSCSQSQLYLPMNLLRKDARWTWAEDRGLAFDCLCESPLLAHFPNNHGLHFGFGAIALRTDPSTPVEHPTAFDSGKSTPAEVTCTVGEKEISYHLHSLLLEGSDKLARDAFVHSVKVFTSLVLFYAFIINYNTFSKHRDFLEGFTTQGEGLYGSPESSMLHDGPDVDA